MQVLVALMAADYLTGVLVAAVWQRSRKTESGALDSKAGYIGLLKKGMILLVVWLGVLLDNALGETYIRMAIMLFFVGNEGLSLLENLGLMGVLFPAFLERALEALREKQGRQQERVVVMQIHDANLNTTATGRTATVHRDYPAPCGGIARVEDINRWHLELAGRASAILRRKDGTIWHGRLNGLLVPMQKGLARASPSASVVRALT